MASTKRVGYIANMKENFSFLWFIMALGMGGTSIAGFALMNYTVERLPGMKGILSMAQIELAVSKMGGFYQTLFHYVQFHIGFFGIMHVLAMIYTFYLFFSWKKKYPGKYKALREDNTRNASTIAPALALAMTFNVSLVMGVFYIPWVKENMQSLMGWALLAWGLVWLYGMSGALRLQKSYLLKGFDVSKMHFGWLLIPFALSMVAVGGAGIAALAKSKLIAGTAFFFSFVPFTFAIFLTFVKLVAVFKSQYQTGLPQKVEFLPSFFIAVPIGTISAITLFRYGHFLHHQVGAHIGKFYYAFVTAGIWAFMVWYLALGILLLKNYLKENLFSIKNFDESQWGLICPMVAFAVLGAFVYKTVLPHPATLAAILFFIVLDVVIFLTMFVRQNIKLLNQTKIENQAPVKAIPVEQA